MSQIELNEGLARSIPKPGEIRNPSGWNNPVQRARNREIRTLLCAEGNAPCALPGYEHLTNLQALVRVLWDKALGGNRWAATTVLNRMFGRVPLDVEMQVTQQPPDLTVLTDTELRARLEMLRELLAPMLEGEVVAQLPEPPVVRGGE
jgi:hypothetical protein